MGNLVRLGDTYGVVDRTIQFMYCMHNNVNKNVSGKKASGFSNASIMEFCFIKGFQLCIISGFCFSYAKTFDSN
jgi:hypothetical protein